MRGLVAVVTICCATTSALADASSAIHSAALTTLLQSKVFTTAEVGLGRATTGEAIAFGQLATEGAKPDFLELARRGTSAGRLYGLCGLKALNDPAYPSVRSEMSRRRDGVRGAGCIAVRTTVDKVLALRKSRDGKEDSMFDVVCVTLIEYSSKFERRP